MLFADLSGHNEGVDLNAYAKAGYKVIALKATEGGDFVSDAFVPRWKLAGELGLVRIAYHFARPSRNTPEAEARHFLAWVAKHGKKATDLLVLDWEDEHFHPGARESGASEAVKARARKAGDEWVRRFKKASGCHLLYTYGPYAKATLTDTHGLAYWHAAYLKKPLSTLPSFAVSKLVAVQFTNGIEGEVPHYLAGCGTLAGKRRCDVNRLAVPLLMLKNLVGGDMSTPSPEFQQARLNWFNARYKLGYAPLIKDGIIGPATRRRIKEVRFYLGQGITIGQLNDTWTPGLTERTAHPNRRKYPGNERRRGAERRLKRRAWVRQQLVASIFSRGVTRYDGKPVAKWMVPYLEWARDNGWKGQLNSGWRSPRYSESLCYAMCGAPACAGRCAGRASQHSGSVPPQGALDVSDYVVFARLMERCPHKPHIFNALGARDPVHFSRNGR